LKEDLETSKMSIHGFKTFIGLKSDEIKEKLETVCKGIALKDPSFKFVFKSSRIPQYTWILIVLSSSYDIAQRRGGWLISKPFRQQCPNCDAEIIPKKVVPNNTIMICPKCGFDLGNKVPNLQYWVKPKPPKEICEQKRC